MVEETPRSVIGEYATERTLTADGFDDAIIGIVERFGDSETVVLYDKMKCIEILVGQGMTEDDAIEHYNFNIIGSGMGAGGPAFATMLSDLL